jgi:hypothetical protein
MLDPFLLVFSFTDAAAAVNASTHTTTVPPPAHIEAQCIRTFIVETFVKL